MKKITIIETDNGIDVSVECENEMDVMEIHRMLHGAMREIKIKHMKSKSEKK